MKNITVIILKVIFLVHSALDILFLFKAVDKNKWFSTMKTVIMYDLK